MTYYYIPGATIDPYWVTSESAGEEIISNGIATLPLATFLQRFSSAFEISQDQFDSHGIDPTRALQYWRWAATFPDGPPLDYDNWLESRIEEGR